jgi:hypothetical protein
VYIPSQREVWLNKIKAAGVRRRAEYFYRQLDTLLPLRKEVHRELLSESRSHGNTA